jgi:hypothetical protein
VLVVVGSEKAIVTLPRGEFIIICVSIVRSANEALIDRLNNFLHIYVLRQKTFSHQGQMAAKKRVH